MKRLSANLRPIFELELRLGNQIARVDEPAGTSCPLAVVFASALHFDAIGRDLTLSESVERWVSRDPHFRLEAGFLCKDTRHCLAGPLG